MGTNPFLYGLVLLSIVSAASLPILLIMTATLFTIGQVSQTSGYCWVPPTVWGWHSSWTASAFWSSTASVATRCRVSAESDHHYCLCCTAIQRYCGFTVLVRLVLLCLRQGHSRGEGKAWWHLMSCFKITTSKPHPHQVACTYTCNVYTETSMENSVSVWGV